MDKNREAGTGHFEQVIPDPEAVAEAEGKAPTAAPGAKDGATEAVSPCGGTAAVSRSTPCPKCGSLNCFPIEAREVAPGEFERARLITIQLEHQTSYHDPDGRGSWNWSCACGLTDRFTTWADCHKRTREHWADVILAAVPISLPPIQLAAREAAIDPSGVRDIPARDLVMRALRNMRPTDPRPRWSWVEQRFGLGSTYSIELCRNFGLDPHEQIGRAPDPEEEALASKEVARLTALINTPEIIDFVKAVQIEAVHQRERWGTEQDEGKTAADWFWLLGYLAGKALHSDKVGDQKKLLHHIITTAAACANWHAQVLGKCDMRPGIETPKGEAS